MFERLGSRGAIALSQLLVAGTVVVGGAGVGVGLEQAGVFGGGDETLEVSLDAVSTFDCPDGGEVGEVHRGDRVLATGRDEGGDWIEIRDPRDLNARVWLRNTHLVPDADLSGLDTLECKVLVTAATITSSPVPTTTAPGGGGGGGGTPADTTGPTIGAVGANPAEIWELYNDGSNFSCSHVTASTISASVSDPSGIKSVTLSWQVAAASGSKPMSGSGTYSAVLGPFDQNTLPLDQAEQITVRVTAVDNRNNSRTATRTVLLHDCTFV